MCEIFKSLFKSTILSLKRYYAMLSQVVLFANKTKFKYLDKEERYGNSVQGVHIVILSVLYNATNNTQDKISFRSTLMQVVCLYLRG